MALTFSFSGIKNFEGCQRRFYHEKIAKTVKQQDTVATLYGTQCHEAFELYIGEDKPLDPRFEQFKPFVEPLKRMEGEILVEHEMGLRKDFSPCGFKDEEVWLRGIADYLALNHAKGVARCVDFKTGKSARYADTDQLELMAAMVMQHYPAIHKVKGALLFVVAGDIIKADYTRDQLPTILSKWAGKIDKIEKAIEIKVWNPSPSGLCKFCPVKSEHCEHK